MNGKRVKIANVHLSGGRFDENAELFNKKVGRAEIVQTAIQHNADIIMGDFNGEIDNHGNARRLARDYNSKYSTILKWLDEPFDKLHNYTSGSSAITVPRYDKQVDFIFRNSYTEKQSSTKNIHSDHLALIKTLG